VECETAAESADNPVTRMTDAEFERHLVALMRRNPVIVEQFLRRMARIHGGRIPWGA
jgi:hypothetical protein